MQEKVDMQIKKKHFLIEKVFKRFQVYLFLQLPQENIEKLSHKMTFDNTTYF